jgi:hypothetical protein
VEAELMRLLDLQPQWLRRLSDKSWDHPLTLEDADGVLFLCPKCMAAAKGHRPGVHAIICWRPHIPQTVRPGPGRWEFEGTGFGDLTLRAGSSSVALQGGCAAHFFIRRGTIEMC